ncbi:Npt1/Npt2 family nucleotide transporter [Lewinella cohaerens]|uniref:Npt1/Npt2 family nucleotide transporter n=1 Tax=Lewinella cohaerens TaxID=70995 RepID=UPI000373F9E5|nr:Npt1/Npt2 family nucleotide transporter [Lewinella cohaerens]
MSVPQLRRKLQMHEGEGRRLFPLLLLMFLTLTNLILLKSTASSLFLAELGAEQLPIAFLWVAITAAVSTLVFSVLTQRFSLTTLIQVTHVVTASITVWFMLLLKFGEPGRGQLYIFYVWSNLFGVITVSQVYLLAGELFGIREAKRLFVWVGVAAISGGVFGGYLTSVLATFLSRTTLLSTAAGLSGACIIAALYLRQFSYKPQTQEVNSLSVVWREFWYPFQYFRQSHYLHLVAGIVTLAVIVAKLVEYQYSSFALETYKDVEDLAAFFGFWLSTISLLSLGVQLLFTKYALKNIGVSKSLQMLPLGLLAAMLILLFFPLLWAVVIARAIDGGFKQSLHKSAFELLLLPLPNAEKKFSKTFIDVFVDSIATGISGLLLIFFVRKAALPTEAVTLLTIGLLLIWVWITVHLGKAYLNTFRLRLNKRDIADVVPGLSLKKSKILPGMAKLLEEGSISQMNYVLKKLPSVGPQDIFEQPLVHLLDHPHSEIRVRAITCLTDYKRVRIDKKIMDLLENDPSISVKVEALFYLVRRQPHQQLQQLVDFLDDENDLLADVALLTLVAEVSGNPVLWEKLKIKSRLETMIATVSMLPTGTHRNELQLITVRAIEAAREPDFFYKLEEWLPSSSFDVCKGILQAMGNLKEERFLPFIWNQLKKDQGVLASNILAAFDEDILLPFLEKKLRNESPEELHLAPRILGNLPSPKAVAFLLDWLTSPDQTIRDEAINALCKIQSEWPQVRFDRKRLQRQLLEEASLFQRMLSLLYAQLQAYPNDEEHLRNARRNLLELLESRLDRNIERIFRLLDLRYSSNDFLTIYVNLKDGQPDQRSSALEFLENLLEPSLMRLILPVAELVVMDLSVNNRGKALPLELLEEETCYREIFALNDHQLSMSLLTLIRQDKASHYTSMIRPLLASTQPLLRTIAQETLDVIDPQ